LDKRLWTGAAALSGARGIVALRTRLVPEWPIYTLLTDRPSLSALAGRIDAIAYDGDLAEVVVDWKSDVDPDETDMRFIRPA
jgi:hypothetical protein